MKKTSIHQLYWLIMICNIFGLICGVVGSILMIINYKEFIYIFGKILGIIFLIVIVGLFFTLIIFPIKQIVILLKDYKSLRNKEFVSVLGKVIKFKRNIEPESGSQINDNPIVLSINTNEIIELFVNDEVTIGEIYEFNYLKNCRIAEIVNKL